MCISLRIALVLGMTALVATPASAQDQELPPHLRQPGLLRNQGVQEELKLTEEEAEKAKKLAQEAQEKYQLSRQMLRELKASERSDKEREYEDALNVEVSNSLADMLRPKQLRRFGQIELQWRGPAALNDREVRRRLELTDDQRREVARLDADSRREFQTPPRDDQVAETGARRIDLRKRGLEKFTALLSDAQKQTWKEMIGEPFKFESEARPSPGGDR
ncbi:MAG: hypothetical protein WKF75_00700 [Singulisphaera sp.]